MVTWELGAMAVKSTPSVTLQEPSVVAEAASTWTLQHVEPRHCWRPVLKSGNGVIGLSCNEHGGLQKQVHIPKVPVVHAPSSSKETAGLDGGSVSE